MFLLTIKCVNEIYAMRKKLSQVLINNVTKFRCPFLCRRLCRLFYAYCEVQVCFIKRSNNHSSYFTHVTRCQIASTTTKEVKESHVFIARQRTETSYIIEVCAVN